ncbi:TonB-dependent receptor, partial [Flavihumibacter sp. CACIAM 22H1]|uniref:TonB-dependent receptor n=1 Tax=Flavihumibacter sp. CACIAM 22H1 TaxID=1812911 RepID=UPI0025BDDF1B
FTLFGMNGWNDQEFPLEKDPAKWEEEWNRYGGIYKGRTNANGITHTISLSKRASLKTVLVNSSQQTANNMQFVARPDSIINAYREKFQTKKWILSSTLNTQLNRKQAIRTGVIAQQIDFSYLQRSRENNTAPVEERINSKDQTQLIQAFAQWQYKPSNQLVITGGAHFLYLNLNQSLALEPRAAIQWNPDNKNSFGFGYGLHSQAQIMGVYFAKSRINDQWVQPNKELGFTKSHHFVGSYTRLLMKGLKLRTEIYYQHLFNLPVSIYDTATVSTVNIAENFVLDPLTNKGKGRNYGLELSLEKQLRNYFYFLFSNSLYQSKYTAADGKERNTRYNGGMASTLTMGKEFVHPGNRRSFGANIKIIYAGGFRDTPLDEEATLELGYAKYRDEAAFTIQNPAYFRTDIRLSMKWNAARMTSILSLDIQNLTNRQNIYGKYYDSVKGKITTSYQAGLIPVLAYRIEF